jgi:hypothetical protein
MNGIVEDVMLAEELKQFVNENKNIRISTELINKLNEIDNSVLVSFIMEFYPYKRIIDIKLVDEEYIQNSFATIQLNE